MTAESDGGRRRRISRRSFGGALALFAISRPVAALFRPPPIADSEGWRERARMPSSRGEMKGAVLDDRIYVPGGLSGLGNSTNRMDVYDPAADEWASAAPMPEGLNHHATAALDGTLYVVGGNRSFDDPPEAHCFAYDPHADEWTVLEDAPEGRWGHELVAVDDRLYAIGGHTTDSHDVLTFDPGADVWDRGPPIPTPRDHLAAGVVDDRILAVGGRWDGENVPTVEAYDPDANEWEPVRPEPEPRSGAAGAVVDGRYHLGGGEDPAAVTGWTTDVHEAYDPEEGAWTDAPAVPLPLHGPTAVAHDGAFYVIGGAWRQGLWSATAWSDRTFVYEP